MPLDGHKFGIIIEQYRRRKAKIPGEKPVPGPLSIPQISYQQARDRTRLSDVKVWQKITVSQFWIQIQACKDSQIYTGWLWSKYIVLSGCIPYTECYNSRAILQPACRLYYLVTGMTIMFRSHWPPPCWDCGFESRAGKWLFLLSLVWVSASGWSLVQRSPIECVCVCVCAWGWSWSLYNEEALAHWELLHYGKIKTIMSCNAVFVFWFTLLYKATWLYHVDIFWFA